MLTHLSEPLKAALTVLMAGTLTDTLNFHVPELSFVDDLPTEEPVDMVIMPVNAFPAQDAQALPALGGVKHDEQGEIMLIDTSDPTWRNVDDLTLSPGLKKALKALSLGSVRYLLLLSDAFADDVEPFTDVRYTQREEDENSCIGNLMCPACGHRDHFILEVIGADPDDVDPMESQSRIQARSFRGELKNVRYMADFHPDGSEDTVSSTEWPDDGGAQCPHCLHEALRTTFESLHDCTL